jgi:8-oxo-dGTP diphosphatase
VAKTHFVAKAIVLEKGGKFLLLTRSETHPTLAGFFDLPGGMIKPGEEPGAALMREINEEVAIETTFNDLTPLYATTMLINNKSYPTLLYLVRLNEEEPGTTISWEHSSAEWAPLERLAEVEPQLAPTYREALGYIQDNRILEDV